MKRALPRRRRLIAISSTIALVCIAVGISAATAAQPVTGAVFTTDSSCSGVDLNIYANKADVFVNGGPAHPGAAGLPDGDYYVQVTDPSGASVLGKSSTAVVTVSGGEFAQCYQLADIVDSAGSGFTAKGYDDTPNAGGEYKVWISTDSSFTNSLTKTDNFKVKNDGGCEPNCEPPPQATLSVEKFYDANANGINDDGQSISGWEFNIHDGIDWDRFTPIKMVLDPDEYVVTESTPLEPHWIHTTENPVSVTLADGDDKTVEFGNLCTGAGGGLTLGFWSNKNGEKQFNVGTDLTLMKELNLVDAKGKAFDPASYSKFRSWLLEANASNMAYMLSAQLAAMELNVLNGNVNGSSLIYAPGTGSANALGFATVGAVMAEANTELGIHPLTLSGSGSRSYQEALKNALDKANNNLTFVQGKPCPFSFAS